jgi:L-threonylcarbamoyladenylate synthase
VTEEAEEWIRKLPGPYTLILKLKNKKALANNVYDASNDTIGIRMPNHWFLAVVFQIKVPIITTSANISGDEFMTSLEDLDPMIRNNVDYVFYDGIKRGMPSTIIHLDGSQIKIQPRIERSKNPKIRFPIEEISINK